MFNKVSKVIIFIFLVELVCAFQHIIQDDYEWQNVDFASRPKFLQSLLYAPANQEARTFWEYKTKQILGELIKIQHLFIPNGGNGRNAVNYFRSTYAVESQNNYDQVIITIRVNRKESRPYRVTRTLPPVLTASANGYLSDY